MGFLIGTFSFCYIAFIFHVNQLKVALVHHKIMSFTELVNMYSTVDSL